MTMTGTDHDHDERGICVECYERGFNFGIRVKDHASTLRKRPSPLLTEERLGRAAQRVHRWWWPWRVP